MLLFNIKIMWDKIWIEFLLIFILIIVLAMIRMVSISTKLKTIDTMIYEGKYDNALTIIQKSKNSRLNKKNIKLTFVLKEMIVYCFLNNRQEFDIAREELYNSKIYRYKSEFWNIMFYFMNEKENPELDKLLENYKNTYQKYTGFIIYLNVLYNVKNGNLQQAKNDYELIAKKIKTKFLKNILNLFYFKASF